MSHNAARHYFYSIQPLLKTLTQKETTADMSHVAITMILIQVTDSTGYLPKNQKKKTF